MDVLFVVRSDETPRAKMTSPITPKPQSASLNMKSYNGKLFPKLKWKLQSKLYRLDIASYLYTTVGLLFTVIATLCHLVLYKQRAVLKILFLL